MCAMKACESETVDREIPLVLERGHRNKNFRVLALNLSTPDPNYLTSRKRNSSKYFLKNNTAEYLPETGKSLVDNFKISRLPEIPRSATDISRGYPAKGSCHSDPSPGHTVDGDSRKSNSDTVFSLDDGYRVNSKLQFVQNGDHFAPQYNSLPQTENLNSCYSFCDYNFPSRTSAPIGVQEQITKIPLAANNRLRNYIGANFRGKSHANPILNSPNSFQNDVNSSLHSTASREYKEIDFASSQDALTRKFPLINEDYWLSKDSSRFSHSNVARNSRFVCADAETAQDIFSPNMPDSSEVNSALEFAEPRTSITSGVFHHSDPRSLYSIQECLKVMPHSSLDQVVLPNKESSSRHQNLGSWGEVCGTEVCDSEAGKAHESSNSSFTSEGKNRLKVGNFEGRNMCPEISLENSRNAFKDADYASFNLTRNPTRNPTLNPTDDTLFSQDRYEYDPGISDNVPGGDAGEEYLEDRFESLNINLTDNESGKYYANAGASSNGTFSQLNTPPGLSNYRSHRPVNIRIDTRYIHGNRLHNSDFLTDSSVAGWPYSTHATGEPESSTFIDSGEINDINDITNNTSSVGTIQKQETFSSDVLTMPVGLTPTATYYKTISKKNTLIQSPVQCGTSVIKNRTKSSIRYNELEDTADDNVNYAFTSMSQHYESRPFPALDYAQQSPDTEPSRFSSKSGLLSAPVSRSTASPHRMHGDFGHPPISARANNNPAVPGSSSRFPQLRMASRLKDDFTPFQSGRFKNNYCSEDCAVVVHPSIEFGPKSANVKRQPSQEYNAYSHSNTAITDMIRVPHPMMTMQLNSCFDYNCNYNSYSQISSWAAPGGSVVKTKRKPSFIPAVRGSSSISDNKKNLLLEEIKVSKNSRIELRNILGNTVEFSCDQHGSRFIQQKIQSAAATERQAVFEEILSSALQLMTDVFGNYVIQKFFEYGTQKQRELLAKKMEGNVLSLSLHMYGCRVVQKALECVSHSQQTALVKELEGNIIRCVKDQNGNHVIQKAIELIPAGRIELIISSFVGQIFDLATHPYGCRVVQRAIQHIYDDGDIGSGISDIDGIPELEQKRRSRDIWRAVKKPMLNELLKDIIGLIQDQYGNYVVQHVLERGGPVEKSLITKEVCAQVLQLSRHKFASNVVEKCVTYGNKEDRELLIDEVLKTKYDGTFPLVTMMKDQFANYVVQKMLETSEGKQREEFTNKIKPHLQFLKKYSYGRHLTAKVEKIVATQSNSSTPPS